MTILSQPHASRSQGFTLIEIVMVLVLLGILSAVAVPKYFDLQKEAEYRANQHTLQVLQSEINGRFAEHLLSGKSCAAFVSDDSTNKLVADLNTELKTQGSKLSVRWTSDDFLLLLSGATATNPGDNVGRLVIPSCNR